MDVPQVEVVLVAEASLELVHILKKISIIIPIAPDDLMWVELTYELIREMPYREIILVGTEPEPNHFKLINHSYVDKSILRWVYTEKSRAKQLNYGATIAKGEYLWFLHADSRFDAKAPLSLAKSLLKNYNGLHYFDLVFYDSFPLMYINTAGVWLRSHWLKMPFGDQGFCLSKKLFFNLNGYPIIEPFGEDHLLIWHARKHNIKLCPVNSVLYTSARKYQKHGWFQTTTQTIYLTWKQAIPEWYKLIKARITT